MQSAYDSFINDKDNIKNNRGIFNVINVELVDWKQFEPSIAQTHIIVPEENWQFTLLQNFNSIILY